MYVSAFLIADAIVNVDMSSVSLYKAVDILGFIPHLQNVNFLEVFMLLSFLSLTVIRFIFNSVTVLQMNYLCFHPSLKNS
jgi:hypothetical protein